MRLRAILGVLTMIAATLGLTLVAAQPAQASGCNPAYPQLCLTHDVKCADLTARNFTVLSSDPYRLDADNDGIGCEDPGKPVPYLPGVVTTPTTQAAPSTSSSPAPGGSLPVTGPGTGVLVAAATVFILGGLALRRVRRQRPNA